MTSPPADRYNSAMLQALCIMVGVIAIVSGFVQLARKRQVSGIALILIGGGVIAFGVWMVPLI